MNSNGIKSCKVDHRMQGEIVLPENTVRFYTNIDKFS
jgi:sporulation-control protein spo0M